MTATATGWCPKDERRSPVLAEAESSQSAHKHRIRRKIQIDSVKYPISVKRTPLSYEVSDMLLRLGFDEEFSEIVGDQMNTDFTARMMSGYLRDAKPTRMEDVADEMLWILEFRDKCMEKIIRTRRWKGEFFSAKIWYSFFILYAHIGICYDKNILDLFSGRKQRKLSR